MKNNYKNIESNRVLLCFGVLLCSVFFLGICSLSAQSLSQTARDKMTALQLKISDAEQLGIDTYKEKMIIRTAEVFLEFADWDEANQATNTSYFGLVPIYKDTAAQAAAMLPDFERADVITMLDDASKTLSDLIEGKIFRKPATVVDWAEVSHSGDQLLFSNRPVFLADYTWKPDIAKLTEFHGNQDGVYFDQNRVVDATGKINSNLLNEVKTKPDGTIGFIFLGNRSVPAWAETKYGPGFKMRETTFTGYDIDNPGALEINGMLFRGTIPYMAGKKYTQLGYLLCNEPHFYTTKTGSKLDWASGPVSDYTITKFKNWLKEKHGNIANLNTLWGTSFSSFEAVTIEIPIDNALQGTPKWYDWVTFNCNRVTQYYSSLKDSVKKYDPQAKIHLKIMPILWSENKRGHGIDMEALTELSEIIGNDTGSDSYPMWGSYEWQNHYAYDWRELFTSHDFYKSVSPDKIMYNTEAHYLSTNRSRNLFMDPTYARASFWAATTTGMTATQIWFWPRKEDGSLATSEKGYAGSNNQQPRVTAEVASTYIDLNTFSEEIVAMQRQRKPIRIFYSETSATNNASYMDQVFEPYESLNFEGIPLGYVTKNILNNQNSSRWDMVLIYKTEFVTLAESAAVQNYLNGGGTVLIDAVSFKKDEYKRAIPSLTKGNGQLIVLSDLAEMKTKALQLVEANGHTPAVQITETNSQGVKTCTWKCVMNDKGHPVLSVINLGKTDSKLDIKLKNANIGTTCTDLINGVVVSSNPTLKPNEVFFVEVTDDNQLPTSANRLMPQSKSDIYLYPNPTNGAFKIDFEKKIKDVYVSICTMEGKTIQAQRYCDVDEIQGELLNCPSGLYLLKLQMSSEIKSFILIKKG